MDYVGRAAGRAVAADLLRRIQSHVSLLAETPDEIGVVRPELSEG